MDFVKPTCDKTLDVNELPTLPMSALIDLLSEQTTLYTRLLADRKRNEEFSKAKDLIKRLQTEIASRRREQELGIGS